MEFDNKEEELAWFKLWCSTWLLNNPDCKYDQSEDDENFHFINLDYKGKSFSFMSEIKDEQYRQFWDFIENIDKNLVKEELIKISDKNEFV
jgi:hypothetical protein